MANFDYNSIQLLRNKRIFGSKEEALEAWRSLVVENADVFGDGDEIGIRYTDENGVLQTVLGIINIDDSTGDISISTGIDKGDTKLIVESEEEPDKEKIWITTDDGSESVASQMRSEIDALNKAMRELIAFNERVKFLMENEINPGDIFNSTKKHIEDSAEQEEPDVLSGDTSEYEFESDEEKPETSGWTPNVTHILMKSANSLDEIRENIDYILPNELIYCMGDNGLYTKHPQTFKLVKLNGSVSPDTGDTDNIIDIMTQSGVTFTDGVVGGITFISPKGNKYDITIGEDGNFKSRFISGPTTDAPTDTPDADGYVTKLYKQKLYINSLYCGGENSDEHSFNYCSHNFVELSNLTDEDINLNGLALEYAQDLTDWEKLELRGTIKAGSTFLIRGAQCSVMSANTTKIIVDKYDMEWRDSDGDLIKFNNTKGAKFYLTYNTSAETKTNPWKDTANVQYGYIDLVGLGNTDGFENKLFDQAEFKDKASNRIYTKYYTMDPVSQATKALNKRNNANDWNFVDLSKEDGEVIPNIECYKPMASEEGKNIFFNKTKLEDGIPTIITCGFGMKANDQEDGEGATRCFNWVSKGQYDEKLWYIKKGSGDSADNWWENHDENDWTRSDYVEEPEFIGDDESNLVYNAKYYYNDIVQEYTDGTVFTAHKRVISGFTAGTYAYKAGQSFDKTNEVNTFEVKLDSEVKANGFTFVQTSDQQGFNWDEYMMWKYAARQIMAEDDGSIEFMINTGDMTQNGNRMNEWIDYFNAKKKDAAWADTDYSAQTKFMADLCEMSTIGNNDLSPAILYKLGNGQDSSKINPFNHTFFYTFEIDQNNLPIFFIDNQKCFVPSLYSFDYGKAHFICVNSEIPAEAETAVYKESNGKQIYTGNNGSNIKAWIENDIATKGKAKADGWNIIFCHEMPFTIVTEDFTNKVISGETVDRGGSRLNTNSNTPYWFSEMCQNPENNIRLVIGGHKHTQAATYPLKENITYNGTARSVDSVRPIIQVNDDFIGLFSGSTRLVEYEGDLYPDKWFIMDGDVITDVPDETKKLIKLCKFESAATITAPVYAMSQATGYKHTSNKELPSPMTPWECNYYPNAGKDGPDYKANSGQKFPFFTLWNVTDEKITGNVKKVFGIFNKSGKFNINIEGQKAKYGTSSDASAAKIYNKDVWKLEITKDSFDTENYE